MNRIFTLIFFILVSTQLKAQTYTNNWVTPGTNYAKISVSQTGIYELTGQELAVALPGVIGAASNSLSLIYLGKPVAIEVVAAGATFQATDKIRFYGRINNGELESELYRPTSDQPHKLSSLYSSKSHYYLSINAALHKSINNESEIASATNIAQVTSKQITAYTSDFTFNSTTGPIPILQHSFFERGEGPSGPIIRANVPKVIKVPVKGITSPFAKLELLLNGREQSVRKVRVVVADKDTSVNVVNFNSLLVKLNLALTLPVPQDSVSITLTADADRFSVSVVNLSFTKAETNEANSGTFYLPANANVGNVSFSKINANSPIVYNITDVYNIKKLKVGASTATNVQFITDPAVKTKENIYYQSSIFIKPDSIKPYISRLTLNSTANYLIISNKKLKASAERYRDFRSSAEGGSHIVELVYIDDLYNDFGYGILSPLAIKNYLRLKLASPSPKNLLLIGKAFSAYTGINSATDLVPSIGYPASDLLLSSGIISHIDVFGLATGRIPATTDIEVDDYLLKVKAHLNQAQIFERKKVFHFNGGKTNAEITNFGTIMDNLGIIAVESDFGASLQSKRKTDPAATAQPANLGPTVNGGQALMGYFGHSSYTSLDFNIGFTTDPVQNYNNSQYPIFYFSGCAFNNYFREINTLSKDWIFAKNKGAVAIVGQSYYGYESALTKHGTQFYETIFKSAVEPTIGEALKISSQKVQSKAGFTAIDVLNNNQTLLFGDPEVKIFGFREPDYMIDQNSFSQVLAGNNRTVKFKITNNGKKSPEVVRIKVTEEGLPNNVVKFIDVPNFATKDSVTVVLENITLLSKIKIEIDSPNSILESNESNNTFIYSQTQGTNPTVALDDIIPSLSVGTTASIDILQNDKLYNAAQATSLNTTVDLDPLTSAIETTLLVPGQGTWTYSNGLINFAPVNNFLVDPKPLIYSLTDNTSLGRSLATVVVDYKPVAANNTAKFPGGAVFTLNVALNDVLGDSIKLNTVNLIGSAGMGQALIVPNQGTWSVLNGAVTFSPALGFYKDPTPIKYTIQDRQGNVSNEVSIILDALPLAKNDISGYNKGNVISVNVLVNDNQGDLLDLSTLKFVGNPNINQTEGVWSLSTNTGMITFTPTTPNSLVPPVISYQISDFQGNVTVATLELDGFPPIALTDDGFYYAGLIKTIDVLANDVSGDRPIEAFLVDPDLNSNGKRKTVINEGIWEVLADNSIRFTPLTTFGGSPSTIRYYSTDSQGSASNQATITLATILPVELSMFKGQATSKGNLISWNAASERGFSHFELLKSSDLKEFYKIQTIQSNSKKSYSYLDSDNIANVKYYRLRMVDIDGTLQYSKIVSLVQSETQLDWLLYPNPILVNKVQINYLKNIRAVKLFNTAGKLITDKLKVENQVINLEPGISAGEYLLVLETEEGPLSKRISIQK